MARRAIIEYPDKRLRMPARPVTAFDRNLMCCIDDLLETLYASRGIGLAANQIGLNLCVLAINVAGNGDQAQIFINPHILVRSQVGWVEESCLSLPGIVENVKRDTRVRVRTFDHAGIAYERDLEGTAAVCLQHEMDHLQGKLFVDRLSFFKRRRAIKRFQAGSRGPTPTSVRLP